MAYDVESDRIVLFGGARTFDSGLKDDTWAYDFNANTWSEMNPSTGPSPRGGHAMAYDAESDRVILFGGDSPGPETWAYDYSANTWTNMSPAIQPTAWSFTDMAYDSESDRIVLFGGCEAGSLSSCPIPPGRDETWAYDYNANTWTNRNPSTSPSGRLFHRMAYDAESRRIVLFGGGLGQDQFLGDTWAYNFASNSWTEMSPEEAPIPRDAHGMAYDSNADRIVLFGGGIPDRDTWAYDFNSDTWISTDSGTGPSRRVVTRMAYDTESDRMVLYGGQTGPFPFEGTDETWAHQLLPTLAPIDAGLVAIIIGVVAAVVVIAAFALTRRRSRMRRGGEGE